ncbi:MAG: TIGR00268 family protein [Candidatus Melainabacteria bacterium GWF2_32_7]|nr:MAG: TIGR00268 family protein [Candidatus Melainabacteria bacterium GWF2_32_7]
MLNKLDKIKSEKYPKLANIIQNYGSAVVAYSGGIDSTLLAYITHHILAQKSLIITAKSEFITDNELKEAQELAKHFAFNHTVIDLKVLDNSDIRKNNSQRCRYCKELIFSELVKLAKTKGYQYIFDGSNIDDINDYRPGFEAIKKLEIKSPFIEAGFSKADIRETAKDLGLSNWNKPALACLASRIPYETAITKENLYMIEQAESYLKDLGYSGFRVRHHDKIARIELNQDDIEQFISKHRKEINLKLQKLGYNYVCLDLKGYRTGSLNESIEQ